MRTYVLFILFGNPFPQGAPPPAAVAVVAAAVAVGDERERGREKGIEGRERDRTKASCVPSAKLKSSLRGLGPKSRAVVDVSLDRPICSSLLLFIGEVRRDYIVHLKNNN